jgi:adenylate cyclase
MAADIADYTRLMGADQASTLRALQAFRADVLYPAIADHGGELIKDMGDGWLAEFQSVGDAVKTALSVQEGLAGQSLLRLRIGINIGDVLHEGQDIFGDGVNVAARLQETISPGGIALSGAAYDVLDGTLAPSFSDAGLHDLKNVARAVRIWAFPTSTGIMQRVAESVVGPLKVTRLAVRPFEITAQDDAMRDLAVSVRTDILRLLSSSDWISARVAPAGSDNDYVLSTVLRSRGDQLRFEVVLKPEPGDEVWAETYDGTMSESFELQDRAGIRIAANTVGAIMDCERARLSEKSPEALTARECLEYAVLEFFEISDETLAITLEHVARAIQRDPDFAPAYLLGARCLLAAVAVGYRNGVRDWLHHLPEWLDRAGDAHPRLRLYRAIWFYMETRDAGALGDCVREVLAVAPHDLDVLCLGGWAHVWMGEPDRAIECFRSFERIGPFNALNIAVHAGLAMAFVQSGRDTDAVDQARRILRRTGDFAVPFRVLAAAAAHLGDEAEARDAVAGALRLVPGDSTEAFAERSGLADMPANRRFLEGLAKAGFPAV